MQYDSQVSASNDGACMHFLPLSCIILHAQSSVLLQTDVTWSRLCHDCLMSVYEPGLNCSMMNHAGSDQSRWGSETAGSGWEDSEAKSHHPVHCLSAGCGHLHALYRCIQSHLLLNPSPDGQATSCHSLLTLYAPSCCKSDVAPTCSLRTQAFAVELLGIFCCCSPAQGWQGITQCMRHTHAGKVSQQLRVSKHCAGILQLSTVTRKKLVYWKCIA